MRNGFAFLPAGVVWAGVVSIFLIAVPSFADDKSPAPKAPVPESLQKGEAELRSLKQQEQAASEQVIATTRKLDLARQRLEQLGPEIEALNKTLAELRTRMKTDQDAAQAAIAAQKKADGTAAATAKASEQAAEKLKKSQQLLSDAEKKAQDAMAASTAAKEEISKLNQMLTVARETAEKSRLSWLKQEQKVQQLMRDAGLWVSFSKEIAPILHARCLACHNANQTEGGLSLATYSALMAGGESGSIIDPVDRAASLLCTLLEDGSMPKDADPLTPMQKATVKKWVLGGARLDSGVDSQAPLIELMPRVRQSNAPARYRAPLPITALAFSPDGKMLASSGYHEVLVWSAETQLLQKRISNVAERVYDIAYSPDGLQLAVAAGTPGQLGEVKVFDAQTGGITADLQVSGDVILGVSYSPDGKRLASCGADGTLRVFNLQSQTKILQISAHADWVNDVNWSADGQRLVSCGRDKTVKIFDAQSGDSILSFSGHTDVVTSCFYLPDGNQLVTSGADRVLRISNASDASEIRKIGGFSGAITQLLVLPDSRVVTASIDKNVRIHQAADGKPLLTFEAPTDEVLALAANVPTGTIATGSLGGEIRLVKISDGKIAKKWLAVPPAP